ncbi:MAG: transglutaminase family protein [Firmicutes bacterium]|nr:transglutaminase family protein [Bacillota bacterium]
MESLLENLKIATPLLNYTHQKIVSLIQNKGWKQLNDTERIRAVYNFVRDEIAFGYNISDRIKASKVLKDGYGQCNTKGILLMALLRATGIPCRIHGFMVDKEMQKGAIKGFFYQQAPKEILHSWVEIFYKEKWLNLEGFILDVPYLTQLQNKFKDYKCPFYAYAAATPDLQNPPIEWNENDTYIQKDAITQDLGIFDTPDELFLKHKQNTKPFKTFMFRNFVRHSMNRNVRRMRKKGK